MLMIVTAIPSGAGRVCEDCEGTKSDHNYGHVGLELCVSLKYDMLHHTMHNDSRDGEIGIIGRPCWLGRTLYTSFETWNRHRDVYHWLNNVCQEDPDVTKRPHEQQLTF